MSKEVAGGKLKIIISFLCLTMLFSVLTALSETPNQIIIKSSSPMRVSGKSSGLKELDSLLTSRSITSLKAVLPSDDNRFFVVTLSDSLQKKTLIREINRIDGIEYAQPNYLNTFFEIPDDPMYNLQQEHYENIKLPEAWNLETGEEHVLVAVIDSGILFSHPDLQGNIYQNPDEIPDNSLDDDSNGYVDDWRGWDFVDAPELESIAAGNTDFMETDNDPSDELLHGTHVSGIIGAVGNNGTGISGVCWNLNVIPLRAGFSVSGASSGYLQDDDAAAAIIYAANMGADIINISWGDDNFSPIIADACQYAYDHGSVIIASAGNEPVRGIKYPARLSSTISVGAVDRYKNIAGFSSFGPDLDLVAPGVSIYSTFNASGDSAYVQKSGTSMAAPFITGAAALLISRYPSLSNEEIYTRIVSSCTDLGSEGFDEHYGHGLININSLLTDDANSLLLISSPVDNGFFADEFDIEGIVTSNDFSKYSLMFIPAENLESEETAWKNIDDHSTFPNYYFSEYLTPAVLGHFHFPPFFADGEYIIRLRMIKDDGFSTDFTQSVNIDRTAPILQEDYVNIFPRYSAEIRSFYLQLVFDEAVDVQLDCSINGSSFFVSGSSTDHIHLIKLPDYLSEGLINFTVTAINKSGLSSFYSFQNFSEIENYTVDVNGYTHSSTSNYLYPLKEAYDFDNNGRNEIVAMDLSSGGINDVSIYEPYNNELSLKYSFSQQFIPLSAGNTNGAGLEVLGLSATGSALLYETLSNSDYPSQGIKEFVGSKGGSIVDIDDDGYDEVVLIQTYDTKLSVVVYRRENFEFIPDNVLLNSSTSLINNFFVSRVTGGLFDNDQYPDILTADQDGDVLVFELYHSEDSQESGLADSLVWSYRLPVPNAYYLDKGDFNGDGQIDFVVGGYNEDIDNPENDFWFFEFFTSSGDNVYSSLGTISFDDYNPQNSLAVFDNDNDGDDEILFAVTPNLYLVDYQNEDFLPIWKGDSQKTYQICAFKENSFDTDFRFMINQNTEGSEKTVFFDKDAPFTGPATPGSFQVVPTDSDKVKISWENILSGNIRIYRKSDSEIVLISESFADNYIDSGLMCDSLYFYAISKYDENFNPPESRLTLFKGAIPTFIPQVVDLRMTGANRVSVFFDQKLHSSVLNNGNFHCSQSGEPSSVNFINDMKGVLLTFRDALPSTQSEYLLTMKNLKGNTGVPIPDTTMIFQRESDLIPPEITGYNLIDSKSILLHFSEPLDELSSLIGNFSLIPPEADYNNKVSTVFLENDKVRIIFLRDLKKATQPYYIALTNIRDLSGNLIENDKNIYPFSLTEITSLKFLKIVPNPLYYNDFSGTEPEIRFMNIPFNEKGRIKIYSMDGSLIYQDTINPLNADSYYYSWKVVNDSGRRVAPGVYYFLLEMKNDTKKGTIAVIN